MDSWKEIVQDQIFKHADLIKKITMPLRHHFGVGYFSYHRIDKQGNYTVLLSRPDWAEHYVSEKLYLLDPYLRHPDVYESGLCLIESHGTEEYKREALKLGKHALDIDLGLVLIQKQEEFVEFFGFCGQKEKSSLEKLYLNDSGLLTSFATHFKAQVEKILATEESSSLLKLKGEDFHVEQRVSPEIPLETRLGFLQEMGKEKEIALAAKLTRREKQCLQWLLEDKSAKETALLLGISRRTIEFYFENIKEKFSCWSKHEVLAIAKTLRQLGLL